MYRPRVIPALLLKGRGLVKSVRFKDHRYIGDPLNAARIFNDLRADELIFLDIEASGRERCISLDFVRAVAEEVLIPFSVGGGIRTMSEIAEIVQCGVEKVVIGTQACRDPDFIGRASGEFGASTISVCIDVRSDLLGRKRVRCLNGSESSGMHAVEFAKLMESKGAGEIIVQSIDRDGMMNGYDIGLIEAVSNAVTIPVVALGGAGSDVDLKDAIHRGRASAAAAGSLFVYHGKHRGVLINYPEQSIHVALASLLTAATSA